VSNTRLATALTFSLCSRSALGCSNGDVSIVLADGQLEEVFGIYTQGQGRDGCNGPGFSSVHSGNRTTGARADSREVNESNSRGCGEFC
jgi:hypothetical protein